MQVADFPLKDLDLVELELRQIHERSLPSGAKRGSFSEILANSVVLGETEWIGIELGGLSRGKESNMLQ